MNVVASRPSIVACQPGSNATFSTIAPARRMRTRPVNRPSSRTAACDSTAPGAPASSPISAVTGAASRPPYSTDGSTPGRRPNSAGRIRARYVSRSATSIAAPVSTTVR